MEDTRVRVSLPLASVPWSFVALFMLHAFVAMAFVMFAIHNVRRIFQRIRDGSPFDSENAERMRAAGLSLVGLAVFGVVGRVLVPFLPRGLAVEPPNVSAAVSVDSTHLWFSPLPDFPVLFVALVLLALGTIFRRGAELEQEQSLVV
jgi:hypothetical protein